MVMVVASTCSLLPATLSEGCVCDAGCSFLSCDLRLFYQAPPATSFSTVYDFDDDASKLERWCTTGSAYPQQAAAKRQIYFKDSNDVRYLIIAKKMREIQRSKLDPNARTEGRG